MSPTVISLLEKNHINSLPPHTAPYLTIPHRIGDNRTSRRRRRRNRKFSSLFYAKLPPVGKQSARHGSPAAAAAVHPSRPVSSHGRDRRNFVESTPRGHIDGPSSPWPWPAREWVSVSVHRLGRVGSIRYRVVYVYNFMRPIIR